MKGTLHIIQNDPEVPPGNLIEHLPIPHVVHHPYRDGHLPSPEQIAALIVLGGAMGANDDLKHPFLTGLKDLIRTAVSARIPYLGICLGGQLLAASMGAQVVSNRWEERGTLTVSLRNEGKEDHLFNGILQEFSTFQWHNDSFDISEGAVLLASSAACPHQAFRIGDSAWGVQFHPEVTEEIIRDWCSLKRSMSLHAEELLASFRAESGSYHATAARLMKNFLSSAKLLP